MVLGRSHDVGSASAQERSSGNYSKQDGVDGEDHRSFKDKLKHPFPELRDKLKDTHLYDVKV